MAQQNAKFAPKADEDANEDGGVSLRDLALRLAQELDGASAIADDCQAALGEVLEHGVSQTLTERLQALDLLSQRLGDVSDLLRRLAPMDTAGVVPLTMFDAMRLSDVCRRLTGAEALEPAEREAEFW